MIMSSYMHMFIGDITVCFKRWLMGKPYSSSEQEFFQNAVYHARDTVIKELSGFTQLTKKKILEVDWVD